MVMSTLLIFIILLTELFLLKFNLLIADDIVDAEFCNLIGRHGSFDLTHLSYLTNLLLLVQPIDRRWDS